MDQTKLESREDADAVGTDEERRGLLNMVPTSTMSSDESRQRLKQFIYAKSTISNT